MNSPKEDKKSECCDAPIGKCSIYEGKEWNYDGCEKCGKKISPSPTWEKKELKAFEADMLDGDSINDCGGAMIDAKEVFIYMIERMKEVREERYKEGIKSEAGRWFNQSGNEHDRKIRSQALEEVREMVTKYANDWKEPEFSFDRNTALQSHMTETFKKILAALSALQGK